MSRFKEPKLSSWPAFVYKAIGEIFSPTTPVVSRATVEIARGRGNRPSLRDTTSSSACGRTRSLSFRDELSFAIYDNDNGVDDHDGLNTPACERASVLIPPEARRIFLESTVPLRLLFTRSLSSSLHFILWKSRLRFYPNGLFFKRRRLHKGTRHLVQVYSFLEKKKRDREKQREDKEEGILSHLLWWTAE